MQSAAIIGANSLVGQHLIDALQTNQLKKINVWDGDRKFAYRLDENNNVDFSMINSFVGFESLEQAISNTDVVFNLYEAQDFSLIPDDRLLKAKNVAFVQLLVEKCIAAGVTKIVHISSIYVQSSARWPNVDGREELSYEKFRNEVPFPEYCNSKHQAEQILIKNADKIKSISARIGAVYGEGDVQSLICDAILLSKYTRVLPRIGDESGTLQMTYAGNVASALLKCAEKLYDDDDITTEVVLIHDDTPIDNFYELALEPLCLKNDDKEEFEGGRRRLGKKANYLMISDRFISFYIFYPLYFILSIAAWLWTKFFNKNALIAKIPSPYYAYMVFHHWTFYSNFKLQTFFNYKPRFDYEYSVKRSIEYYRRLDIKDITNFSWIPH